MEGLMNFNGDAPAGEEVELLEDGEVLATTTAKTDGTWRIKGLPMTVGRHCVMAQFAGGRSYELEIDVEESESDIPERETTEKSTLSAAEHIELAILEGSSEEPHQGIIARYLNTVAAAAAGQEIIDHDAVLQTLADAGRTVEQFQCDVALWRADQESNRDR